MCGWRASPIYGSIYQCWRLHRRARRLFHFAPDVFDQGVVTNVCGCLFYDLVVVLDVDCASWLAWYSSISIIIIIYVDINMFNDAVVRVVFDITDVVFVVYLIVIAVVEDFVTNLWLQ